MRNICVKVSEIEKLNEEIEKTKELIRALNDQCEKLCRYNLNVVIEEKTSDTDNEA